MFPSVAFNLRNRNTFFRLSSIIAAVWAPHFPNCLSPLVFRVSWNTRYSLFEDFNIYWVFLHTRHSIKCSILLNFYSDFMAWTRFYFCSHYTTKKTNKYRLVTQDHTANIFYGWTWLESVWVIIITLSCLPKVIITSICTIFIFKDNTILFMLSHLT